MVPLRRKRQVGDLWERLIRVVLRDERHDIVDIEGEVGVDEVLDELQLGSGSIDVWHSGYAGVVCGVVKWGAAS